MHALRLHSMENQVSSHNGPNMHIDIRHHLNCLLGFSFSSLNRDKRALVEEVIPLYFGQSKFESFTRQCKRFVHFRLFIMERSEF